MGIILCRKQYHGWGDIDHRASRRFLVPELLFDIGFMDPFEWQQLVEQAEQSRKGVTNCIWDCTCEFGCIYAGDRICGEPGLNTHPLPFRPSLLTAVLNLEYSRKLLKFSGAVEYRTFTPAYSSWTADSSASNDPAQMVATPTHHGGSQTTPVYAYPMPRSPPPRPASCSSRVAT